MNLHEAQVARYAAIAKADDAVANNFEAALMLMKAGKRVMRRGWNGKGQFVWLTSVGSFPQSDTSLGRELEWSNTLMLRNAQNKLTTWVPSIGDILAEDWDLYEERQDLTISDHQHQALEELEQITEKLASLTAFINDPGSTFSMLSTDEQHQLRMKASYQEDYARALKRIADGLGGEGGAV